MVHELLQYAREVEIWHGIPQHEIIDELDRVLSVTATDRKMLGPLPTSYEGIFCATTVHTFSSH